MHIQRLLTLAAILAVAGLFYCLYGPGRAGRPCSPCGEGGPALLGRDWVRSFIDAKRPLADGCIAKAHAWLDATEVDPLVLRTKGIKGKKKLVELLDAYIQLLKIAPTQERAAILGRIEGVCRDTDSAAYHDMASLSDQWFRQDATSYLRAPYLMEKVGLDTRTYRAEIENVLPRLNGHMKNRGANQKMTFHWYYEHFGLDPPFDLADAFSEGYIAGRLNPYDFRETDLYQFTHEIFAVYRFGEREDTDFFSPEDREYMRYALSVLGPVYIMRRDPDAVAELVSCMVYLELFETPPFVDGIELLLKSQSEDGSWGNYEALKDNFGEFVRQGFHLHTTMVAVRALVDVFHGS